MVSRSKVTRQPVSTDETRSKLIAAASSVFADHGYHGATVRQICERAKVNIALVNYHFGDKMELYTEVLRHTMKDPERTRKAHELFARDAPPEQMLRSVIELMLDLMIQRRERGEANMRIMLHELARPTPAIATVVEETVKPIHDRLRVLVGRLLGLPPESEKTNLCTQSIIGQVIHYAHHSPVIVRLWPDLKMSSAQQLMVAEHIADFSLSYVKSISKSIKKTRTALS